MTIDALYSAQQSVLWGGLVLLMLVETAAPRARRPVGRRVRHAARNGLVWMVGILVASVLFGTGFGQAAIWLDGAGVGLMHAIHAPQWMSIAGGFLLLDFSAYVIHRLSHRLRPLWLLHCVHHSDREVDVTTNLRHHPLHVVCTIAWKMVAFAAIGAPMLVLLVHELIVIAIAHVHHAAVAWPRWLDGALSWLIVTPRGHWMHHSSAAHETDANFGATLSWWDRLAGTYLAPGERAPHFGLAALSEDRWSSAAGMLCTPVRARRLSQL